MGRYHTKEFRKIQSQWYDKLKQDGFKDIEQTEDNREYNKTWDSFYFVKNYDYRSFRAKQEYYIRATQMLNHHEFISDLERQIWELHTQGQTLRHISKNIFNVVPIPHFVLLSRVKTSIMKIKDIMLKEKL